MASIPIPELEAALSIRGAQAKASKITGMSPAQMHHIAKGLRPVPIHRAALLEQATGVSRKTMFPNDWRGIWPELAEAT